MNPLPLSRIIAFLVLFSLSFLLFVYGFRLAIEFWSMTRAVSLAIQSLLPPLLILSYVLLHPRRITREESVVLHWAAVAWLAWSAFPWWGEGL